MVWVVRGGQIALGDHSAGFIVVHVGLAAVSIAPALRCAAGGTGAQTLVGSLLSPWASRSPSSRSHPPRPASSASRPTDRSRAWSTSATAGHEIDDDRPVDELARRLFEHGGVEAIHVNGNVATVRLEQGALHRRHARLIEELFIHYRPGIEPEIPAEPEADAESDEASAG